MKTRREFIKFTLGGLACLAAAVMAPKTLMAQKEKLPETEITWSKPFPYATSGYAQIGDVIDSKPFEGTCTVTVSSAAEGWSDLLDPNISRL